MDNRVISSDDPNAIQKLQDKLEMCEKSQKYMKEVNAYYRKNGTCEGFREWRPRVPHGWTNR